MRLRSWPLPGMARLMAMWLSPALRCGRAGRLGGLALARHQPWTSDSLTGLMMAPARWGASGAIRLLVRLLWIVALCVLIAMSGWPAVLCGQRTRMAVSSGCCGAR